NTSKDPAHGAARRAEQGRLRSLAAFEGVQHLVYLVESFRERNRYIIPSRIVLGVCLSMLGVVFWFVVGLPGMVLKIIALTTYNTLVPVSLRAAFEPHTRPAAHASPPD